ncbi:magnesium/cobalt transporter CorA [bacterium]|nr:magnesium/cobalt transporter CorA [bacterium]
MINTYLFTEGKFKQDVSLDDWRSLVSGNCALLWVDISEFSKNEMEDIASKFGLHQLAIESCLDGYRRPHLYEFEDHFYVNMTLLGQRNHKNHGVKPGEMHLFVGSKYIIIASKDKTSDAVSNAIKEYQDTPGLCSRGPMYGVYLLAEDLVESYFPIVENLDNQADDIESQMLENATKRSLNKLFSLKRDGFELRRLLGPQRDIFSELARRDFSFIGGENKVYFQDVYNRMIRIFDMLDTIREILSGSLDIYLSTVSNRLNQVMKVLTVVATILMTLSFITGFYGMNFKYLPWLHAPNAFRNVTILMIAITIGMLWWFRKIKWL